MYICLTATKSDTFILVMLLLLYVLAVVGHNGPFNFSLTARLIFLSQPSKTFNFLWGGESSNYTRCKYMQTDLLHLDPRLERANTLTDDIAVGNK